MFNFILKLLLGNRNERQLKKLQPVVEKVNSLEKEISSLSDEALRVKTDEFKKRLNHNETLDGLLPEAFAVVREAAKRTLNMRHFDVQIMGGVVLHQGKIAEMATGEGKTLVATLSAYLNALTEKSVHIVTVNDYLAKRDRFWMGPIYEFLGLSVGYVQHDMPSFERKKAYQCDITYVTNNEIGFDYLRDNMVAEKEEQVLRELNYAIIDEVDSILIDEARTPLIISGPAEESTQKYYIIDRLVPHLKGRFVTEKEEVEAKHKGISLTEGYDYIVDEKANSVTLTESGTLKCEKMLGVDNLYDNIQSEWVHHITQALRAHNLFKRDVHYVVKDGKVVIVDEFTGRLMPGRRWSDGLHQAIEAKEHLRIAEENQTLATITFQNFFKLYHKVAGMTGTAMTEAAEFWQIYKLDVISIPTNKPLRRKNYPDVIYKTQKEKFNAVVKEIEELHKQGRPMLVGTRSIEVSEKLSEILKRKGIPHNVLNAKHHQREAEIVAQAGRKNAVTIATNMAGRGTDIILGGNPPEPQEHSEVVELGGLHIIGTERHEARRIDNQLRGRAGRQGDPGSSRFYLSLEDELMRLFGSERIAYVMDKLGLEEGQDIQHPLITRAIESAQKKVEAMNFDIRKQLLEFDNVMNKQREAIYRMRQEILEGKDIKNRILEMMEDLIDNKLEVYTPSNQRPDEWNLVGLNEWFKRTFNTSLDIPKDKIDLLKQKDLGGILADKIQKAYEEKEEKQTPEVMRFIERMVTLQVVDHLWKEHLYNLDQLREGIGLRAYGQKDPIVEYKHESYNLFLKMNQRLQEEVIEYIFKVRVVQQPVRREISQEEKREKLSLGRPTQKATATQNVLPQKPKKIGRNDPCWCGSGKKYKKCHGRFE